MNNFIEDLNPKEENIVLTTYALAMVYYLFALYLTITNTLKYIIEEKRYKNNGKLLVLFYLFTFFIIITRPVQLSLQLFQSETAESYYYNTYYLASFVGLALNATILIMAFMIMELRNLVSLPSLLKQSEKSNNKLWVALSIITVMYIPLIVCWFLPAWKVRQAKNMFNYFTVYIVSVQSAFWVFLTYKTY